MSTELIKQFINTTDKVFSTLFKQKVTSKKPFILSPREVQEWDISGIVSTAGYYHGIISLRYKKTFVEELYNLSKVDSSEISKDWHVINDMTGEITNTIAGNVLSIISCGDFHLSIPMTIQGDNHIISWPKNTKIIAIPLALPIGEFELDICMLVDGKPIDLIL